MIAFYHGNNVLLAFGFLIVVIIVSAFGVSYLATWVNRKIRGRRDK